MIIQMDDVVHNHRFIFREHMIISSRGQLRYQRVMQYFAEFITFLINTREQYPMINDEVRLK